MKPFIGLETTFITTVDYFLLKAQHERRREATRAGPTDEPSHYPVEDAASWTRALREDGSLGLVCVAQ